MRSRLPAALAACLALTGVLTSPATAAPPTCFGEPVTIMGTPGDDVLIGTEGKDVIAGLGGNDTIRGLGGSEFRASDYICGGSGDDTIYGGMGQDGISGGPGDDRLIGGPHGDEGDILVGNAGDDRLVGTWGGAIIPGPGDDVVIGADAAWVGFEGARRPMVVDLRSGYAYGEGHDTLINVHDVIASSFPDRLYGTDQYDSLNGSRGNDTMYGRGGGDDFIGGWGAHDRAYVGPEGGTCQGVEEVFGDCDVLR